jgi:hypothetical protein
VRPNHYQWFGIFLVVWTAGWALAGDLDLTDPGNLAFLVISGLIVAAAVIWSLRLVRWRKENRRLPDNEDNDRLKG